MGCSIVFHFSLTKEQSNMLERCQKVCLRVLYSNCPEIGDYDSMLRQSSLSRLSSRREQRVLSFCHRALKHPVHRQMFPTSAKYSHNSHNIRCQEKYAVNFTYTQSYKHSFIP